MLKRCLKNISVSGSIEIVYERPSESRYSSTTSTLTCSTRSQCFENEQKIAIEEEYGFVFCELPPQYDPTTWGWDVTGLCKVCLTIMCIYIYMYSFELSKHIWRLKKLKRKLKIKWSILKEASPYRNGAKNCNLCLQEKLHILKGDKKGLLNMRCEIFSKCRH